MCFSVKTNLCNSTGNDSISNKCSYCYSFLVQATLNQKLTRSNGKDEKHWWLAFPPQFILPLHQFSLSPCLLLHHEECFSPIVSLMLMKMLAQLSKTLYWAFVYKTSILAKLMVFLAKSVLEHEQGKWKKAGNRLKTKVTKLLAIRLQLELMDIHHANILNVKTIKLLI